MGGGSLFPGATRNAEVYSSVTGAFTATGSMITPRGDGHTATLLPEGTVLVAGGSWPYPGLNEGGVISPPVAIGTGQADAEG